jgi:hypothetical protein
MWFMDECINLNQVAPYMWKKVVEWVRVTDAREKVRWASLLFENLIWELKKLRDMGNMTRVGIQITVLVGMRNLNTTTIPTS